MATAMCSSLCVSTPTMKSWRWSAMLGMIVDPFTWSMVRLAGQAGRTGLRWDLVDQAPIRSLPTWPARRYGAARVADTSMQRHEVGHIMGQTTQGSDDAKHLRTGLLPEKGSSQSG